MMIKFTLRCAEDHRFDSWFQSAAAFDKLQAAGMVTCGLCGSSQVEKALMAPSLLSPHNPDAPPLTAARHPAEQALAEFRRRLEAHSDYVGLNFASEARDMHHGLIPERSIYGEACLEEARQLIEEGVPVAPLPFLPRRNSN
jgi:hypothetical protein